MICKCTHPRSSHGENGDGKCFFCDCTEFKLGEEQKPLDGPTKPFQYPD